MSASDLLLSLAYATGQPHYNGNTHVFLFIQYSSRLISSSYRYAELLYRVVRKASTARQKKF